MSERDFPTLRAPGIEPKIHSIFDFSAEALGQLRLWLEMNPPAIGIANVLGYAQSVPQRATVATTETTTSTAFTNLATAGPTLAKLPAGSYLVILAALIYNNTAGVASLMGLNVNGVDRADDVAAIHSAATGADGGTHIGMTVETLTADNNTLTAKYRVNGASTGTFQYRELVAIRMASR